MTVDSMRRTTAEPSPTSLAGPTARFVALDVLRGIAILGTLATNIGIFMAYSYDGGAGEDTFSRHLGTLYGLVTDGKYIGLLTIMFGIGLEIQRQSAVRRGDPWLGAYPWRALLLVVDGLLNYIFIFEYDVLMGYGLTGLVVCFVLASTPRAQRWFLGLGVAAHVAFLTYQSWPQWRAFADDPTADLDPALFAADPTSLSPDQLAQVAQAYDLTPDQYLAEYQQAWETGAPADPMSGAGYWDGVHDRVAGFWSGRGEIPIMFFMGLGLFLVGAQLYRAGLFEERGRGLRLWVMGLAFGVGLPVDWATRLWASDYTSMFNRYLTSTFVSFGLLALVAHFYARGRQPGRVGRAVSTVGRMALTCYIAQNLIASLLFYEWGLNLSERMQWGIYAELAGWLVVSAILLVFAHLWLRFFSRGPVEWVWHVSYTWLVEHTTTKELRRLRASATGPLSDRQQ